MTQSIRTATILRPTTIKGPIVLLPIAEYRTLLAEAGYLPTPKLNRTIAKARARFRKGRAVPWEQVKRALR